MRQIITSLDVGSDSIKIVVGEIYKNKLIVLACSDIKSKGIKKGLIVDSELASLSLKESFQRIEEVLSIKIDKVIANVPSYFAEFIPTNGYTTITREDKTINGDDILRALQACVYNKISSNKELVSIMPVEYTIDEANSVKDPKGKKGAKLDIDAVVSLVPKKNVYPLFEILESMGVQVVDICFGALADYHEFKNNDWDENLGAVINIGKDKTEVSIVNKGVLVSSETLEIGGRNIDRDICYIYNIPRREAVRLKEKFALSDKEKASTSEAEECLTKDNEKVKINQYEISEIVHSRVKEILELCKNQINLLTKKEISYIIITGGTTELNDFDKVFESVFKNKNDLTKVSELGVRHNKFSTALGLIKYFKEKLNFRNKLASTIDEEKQNNMFENKKKVNKESLLGKVYTYFFDN